MNFQELLNELRGLEFTDLVSLYLEAKTGEADTADRLPASTLELISELEEAIKEAVE